MLTIDDMGIFYYTNKTSYGKVINVIYYIIPDGLINYIKMTSYDIPEQYILIKVNEDI